MELNLGLVYENMFKNSAVCQFSERIRVLRFYSLLTYIDWTN